MNIFLSFALAAAMVSCGGGSETPEPEPQPQPDPEPEKTYITFKGSFQETEFAEFKSTWAKGDKIIVLSLKDGKSAEETITAAEISSDGKTATFTSAGILAEGAKYYAYIPETGITGYREDPPTAWLVGNLEGKTEAITSVTVASCEDGSGKFVFRNAFSVMKFKVEDNRFRSVVLTGNNGENVDVSSYVRFGGTTAYGSDNPGTKETRAFTEPGTYYLGLRPGIFFKSGYSLTGYDADGKELGSVKTNEYVKFESGKVYDAGTIKPTKPETLSPEFDESHVVASFAVISDIHINNISSAESVSPVDKFKNALSQCSAMARNHGSDGLDGVLVVGDFIDSPGSTSQLSSFKSAYESVFDPAKVPMFYTVGNHEMPNYAWASSMVSDAKYIRSGLGSTYFSVDVDKTMSENYECREAVLGGIHVLAITPNGDSPITYDSKATSWLESRLKALTEENPNQYVMILTHPMMFNTVYGSRLGEEDEGIWQSSLAHYWASDALTPILRKYPQAVVFGGHLHFPLADPRSIWQGDFTAVGCGSVRYMACENGHYLHMRSATVMNDSYQVSSGNFVQFDWNGNMRIYQMDFTNSGVYRNEPYEIRYPDASGSNLGKYSHTTLSLTNGVPSVSQLSISDVSSSSFTANFEAGTDDEFVHHYVLTVSKGSEKIGEVKIMSDFYLYPMASSMKNAYSETISASDLGISAFVHGTYTVSLKAYDSWDAESGEVTAAMSVGENTEWVSDAAGSKSIAGGDGTVSQDFLTYSNGTLSWSENTTGKPRTATISLPDGIACSVTQISPDDFKGTWSFTAKLFAGTGYDRPAKDPDTWDVAIGGSLKSESLEYANDSRTYTNNIGITGLYNNAVLDGCVDIDYEAQTVRVGLFLDCRDNAGQKISSGNASSNGKYAIFSPDLVSQTSTGWGKPWFFNETDLGNPDYTWMWLTVSSDFSKLSYANRTTAARVLDNVPQYSSDARYIAGICVVLCDTNSFNRATVGEPQAGGYANVFQMNPTGINELKFERQQ